MDQNTVVTILTAFVPIAALVGVGFAVYLMRDVLGRDTGTPEMQEIASTIVEGAISLPAPPVQDHCHTGRGQLPC